MAVPIRKKIKWHIRQAIKHHSDCLQSLKNAYDLAEEKSETLNKYMPLLVTNLTQCHEFIEELDKLM